MLLAEMKKRRMKTQQRIVRSVELSPSAADALRHVKEMDGLPQAKVLSLLIEWYVVQDDATRLRIIAAGLRRRQIERASQEEPPTSHEA